MRMRRCQHRAATPRLTVVYHSRSGNQRRLAEVAVRCARERGAEVRLRTVESNSTNGGHHHVPIVSDDDLLWSDAMIFGSPTNFGSPSGPFKVFLDSTRALWLRNELRDLVVGAMSTSGGQHGGRDNAILSLHRSAFHWGAIVVGIQDAESSAVVGPYGVSFSLTVRPAELGLTAAVDTLVESVLAVAGDLRSMDRVTEPKVAIVSDDADRCLVGLAKVMEEALAEAGARPQRIDLEVARNPATLHEMDAIVVGTVVQAGLPDPQMVSLLRDWGRHNVDGPLAGKPVTGFAVTSTRLDDPGFGILALYAALLHSGTVIVPFGRLDHAIPNGSGNAYGTSMVGTADASVGEPTRLEAAEQAARIARLARRLSRPCTNPATNRRDSCGD